MGGGAPNLSCRPAGRSAVRFLTGGLVAPSRRDPQLNTVLGGMTEQPPSYNSLFPASSRAELPAALLLPASCPASTLHTRGNPAQHRWK